MDIEESWPIINLNNRTFVFTYSAKFITTRITCKEYHFNCTQFNRKVSITKIKKKSSTQLKCCRIVYEICTK